jgi:signal transduction histidine kinase
MIPFAGLAPDERGARRAGEIGAFDLQGALALGQELRRLCRPAQTTSDVAMAAVEVLNSFDHDQRPACVLVRAFVTQAFDSLAAELQEEVREQGREPTEERSLYLRALASRGVEPTWNELSRSPRERVLPLDEKGGTIEAEVVRQLRYQDKARPPATTFFIADPATSPRISDKAFVTAYDVHCVFGFAASASTDKTLVVIAFCRAALDVRAVQLFEVVASYVRVAWLSIPEMRCSFGPESDRVLIEALESMVRLQERLTSDTVAEHRRNVEELRSLALRETKAATVAAEEHARHLSRTQRAMLNVIDDLRQARESLASTVELRTRELATANRKLEARNRELEEFVYIASHDLQEPLRTVGGYLQLVQRRYGGALGVDADEFIRYAIEGAQRMKALIESLLVYSRVTSNDRPLELVPLEEALTLAKKNLALRIEETNAVIECHARLPAVRGNRIQLAQLFQNLLSNSIKFSGPKPPRMYISCSAGEGMHVLEWRDEGIGFNPRFAERIFRIFRRLQRDTPGTGIGLAVCKRIAEAHGGTITADARPGEGATFTIRLPVMAKTEG